MVVKILSYLFIFFVSCQSFASLETIAVVEESTEKTAADVFVEFVIENLDQVDEKDMDYMNNNWENDLGRDVQRWSTLEANKESFLERFTRIVVKECQRALSLSKRKKL